MFFFESLNSLSRSRYQTCSIRFKVGVVRLCQAHNVITGGYAFCVFFEKIQIGLSKIELSFLSTFENHQKITPLAILCIVCSLCSSLSSRLSLSLTQKDRAASVVSKIRNTYIDCAGTPSQQLQV